MNRLAVIRSEITVRVAWLQALRTAIPPYANDNTTAASAAATVRESIGAPDSADWFTTDLRHAAILAGYPDAATD